ncbi:MAG: hypothetical protein P8X96_00515 [Desulfobacteraceae bacterium]
MLHLSKSIIKQRVLFTKLIGAGGYTVAAGHTFRIHFFHGSGSDSHKTCGFARLAVRTEFSPFAVKPYSEGNGAGHGWKNLKYRAKTDKAAEKPSKKRIGNKNNRRVRYRDRYQQRTEFKRGYLVENFRGSNKVSRQKHTDYQETGQKQQHGQQTADNISCTAFDDT